MHRMKYARDVSLGWNDAVLAPALEPPDEMGRDQHEQHGDPEPQEGGFRQQQPEQIQKRVWRNGITGIAHHDLLARFQNRVGEIKLLVAFRSYEDARDNEIDLFGTQGIEAGGYLGCHPKIRLRLQPGRNFFPEVNAETRQ